MFILISATFLILKVDEKYIKVYLRIIFKLMLLDIMSNMNICIITYYFVKDMFCNLWMYK